MNHIELFAGCGGLSLGLESAGFELVLANELSPMAAETFAYNILGEDLERLAALKETPKKTLWLNSNFSDLTSRLKENPFNFPPIDSKGYGDRLVPANLKGKLLVGSIIELNNYLKKTPEFVDLLRTAYGLAGGLDLVSGGPPCQSFSMAGKRERDSHRNTLPWEFANFVNLVKPKIALLENVTGILRAFKDEDGNSFHAWYEIAKVFASIGYVPLCLHINARAVGVPQNRPRFIMIGVRLDHFKNIKINFNESEKLIFEDSFRFYELVQQYGESLPFGNLVCWDPNKNGNFIKFENSFLRFLVGAREVSVREALDDLKRLNPAKPSQFVKNLNKQFNGILEKQTLKNHDFRKNSDLVKRRFRLYQILQLADNSSVTNSIFDFLKGKVNLIDAHSWSMLSNFQFLKPDGQLGRFNKKQEFESYLSTLATKKQTQKALKACCPAPAALSIPDDACHYDETEIRVLTVREMARIQSFPDSFVFRSKVTTGGQLRKFQVPQYTQVGNAVPPLLARALGNSLKEIL